MSTVICIPGNGMGRADLPLQLTLITKYLSLLEHLDPLPKAICFFTEGVRLVAEGSPVLPLLKSLEGRGVSLIVCSTCLQYLGIADQVRVGRIAGMPDILDAQLEADKVVTL